MRGRPGASHCPLWRCCAALPAFPPRRGHFMRVSTGQVWHCAMRDVGIAPYLPIMRHARTMRQPLTLIARGSPQPLAVHSPAPGEVPQFRFKQAHFSARTLSLCIITPHAALSCVCTYSDPPLERCCVGGDSSASVTSSSPHRVDDCCPARRTEEHTRRKRTHTHTHTRLERPPVLTLAHTYTHSQLSHTHTTRALTFAWR